MKKFLIGLFCFGVIGVSAMAMAPQLQENYGVNQYYSSLTSNGTNGTSTSAVNGLVYKWELSTVGGGGGQFHITSSSDGFVTTISSQIYVSTTSTVNDLPRSLARNFKLVIDALDPQTTAYIRINYTLPKMPGDAQ